MQLKLKMMMMHTLDADLLSTVFACWDELGLAKEERDDAMTEMQQAASRAYTKILADAAEAVDKAKGDIERYKADLAAVCAALSCPESRYLDVAALSNASKLLPQIALFESALSAGESALRDRSFKLCSLKERLMDLVSEMWLDETQLTPHLQALMRITVDADPVELAHRLQEARVCVDDDQFHEWEDDLRKLNVSQTTNRLIELQKEAADQFHEWEDDLRKLNVAQTTNRLIELQKEAAELLSEFRPPERGRTSSATKASEKT